MRRGRVMVGLVMAVLAIVSYLGYRQVNPITGQTQSIALTRDQEIALGLQSAPEMAQQMGGLDPDDALQAEVQRVGERVVRSSPAGRSSYRFQFHLLADPQTVNAFALPGGPVFITRGLLARLDNEAELAGVLGHEVGHVVARHTAERIAKTQLGQGIAAAVGVATSDEHDAGARAAAVTQLVEQVILLRYSRGDELQADTLGVWFMSDAGYDPRALISVMDILERAGGGGGQPEFMSTHPDPGNRRERIRRAIAGRFPAGVPRSLTTGGPLRLAAETP